MVTVSEVVGYLRRVVTRPTDELSRAQRALRYAFDLTRHCYRELREDRASQMAAALTYRTIFSLVPLVIMSMLVFRAFADYDTAQRAVLDHVYSFLQADTLVITSELPEEEVEAFDDEADQNQPASNENLQAAPDDPESPTPGQTTEPVAPRNNTPPDDAQARPPNSADDEDAQPTTVEIEAGDAMKMRIAERLNPLFRQAWQLNFKSIGAVGMLLLVWAGLGLMVTVEQSCNRICKAPTGRPWHMRIMVYWAVVTLGPLLLFVSFYMAGQLVDAVRDIAIIGPTLSWASRFTAVGATWLLLVLLYRLMPNTSVTLRTAMIGALVAAICWEISKWGLKLYVANASFGSVYGSLGLIPLFLFWLYITWLIVLFGLELTYTLQAMHGRRFEWQEQSARRTYDSHWLIPLTARIGQSFNAGEPVTARTLAHDLDIPPREIARLSDQLEDAGLINKVALRKGEEGFALARPPGRIEVRDLIALAQRLALGDDPRPKHKAWDYLAELQQAQYDAANGKTLADVIDEERHEGT